MDLSTNQEPMGMQSRFATMYESHVFKTKETYDETDIKGNNNKFNSLKTETNSNHGHDNSSLFQVNCTNENQLEVDNSLFSYSSFKKAMDLRTHNRTLDGTKRTIFDDAEYFAKNYCYKLLPITFEQVDETIIQSEHNYSLSSLNSESEPEEDCSRTLDYSQIKEKNYKKRKTKSREEEILETDDERKPEVESPMVFNENEESTLEVEDRSGSVSPETVPVQPLDLSASHLVQEEKTDPHLRERPNSIVGNDEVAQPDSDKENVNSDMNGIRVTITRPDEKENYQPCDLFLNDIARLVPWLIDKDCYEVDIQDRTCDRHEELRTHRLYYVISEYTWRMFQGSSERVILTNDQTLGQPLRKANKEERPSFLIFDQFSLAKCLADYCQEIGGCFEYTCVEEEKEERSKEEVPEEEELKKIPDEVEEKNVDENISKVEKEKEEEKENEEEIKKEQVEEVEEKKVEEIKPIDEMQKEHKTDEVMTKNDEHFEKEEKTNVPKKRGKRKKRKHFTVVKKKQAKTEPIAVKETKKPKRTRKRRKDSPIQQEPNNRVITTRSKSTSGSETSQKSDKPVSRRGRKKREAATLPKEPPKKRPKPADPEDLRKRTRSGRVLEEVKVNKPTEERKRKRKRRIKKEEKVIKGKEGRSLRSQKAAQEAKVKPMKTRGRKR